MLDLYIMRAYHEEIIDNVVSYIAQRYYSAFHRNITQTLLFKVLALLDFRSLRQNGRPCLELTYSARERGPVPEQLYNRDLSAYKAFTVKEKKYDRYNTRYFISTKVPNLDYLSPSEIAILNGIIDQFISEKVNGSKASEITHKEIKAWKLAYDREPNSLMSYDDEFDNLENKDEGDMTIPELNYMKYREFTRV